MTFIGPYRASHIETWQECPHRYELLYEQDVKPAWRHPKGLNGTALHDSIRSIHQDELWDLDDAGMRDMWGAAFRHAADEPHELQDVDVPVHWGEFGDMDGALAKMGGDATWMLAGYRDDPRNRDAAVIGLEVAYEIDIGGVPVRGRIDQVRDLDGLHVVDTKSTGMAPDESFLAVWTQGWIYAKAVERILRERPKTVTWVQLRDYIPYKAKPKDGPRGRAYYTMDVTDGAMISIEREIKLFHAAVQAGRFERRPSSIGCSYCRVSGRCISGFRDALSDSSLNSLKITEDAYGQGQERS